jgi:uncharacterized membrane protein
MRCAINGDGGEFVMHPGTQSRHSGEGRNPAFLAALVLFSLAACAPTPPPSTPAQERYTARGQEPGWTLTIANGRIDYVGDYGQTRISVPRPDPRTTFNGHRYETPSLTVDITHGRCNDAMSGRGFADQVMVIADGKTVRGCGGERHSEWDM